MAAHENLPFRAIGTLLALLAVPLLAGAKGGCGGQIDIGDDTTIECETSDCGGMPAIACADGTSPYTGRCIKTAGGTCGWESRGCPAPAECDKAACGPAIGAAAYRCPDGSTGGATGRCLRKTDGTCGWEIRECPKPGECSKDECGPAPGTASFLCSDGSIGGFTGVCQRKSDGACGWQFRDCPTPTSCKIDADCGAKSLACCGGKCVAVSDPSCATKPGTCDVPCWPGVDKAFSTEADCSFAFHQISCCGTMTAVGFSTKSAETFAVDEEACRKLYPGCGCPTGPTTAEDGKTGGWSPSEFGVACTGGKCMTYVRTTGTGK